MNLFITGGHLTPALALIDYLQKTPKSELDIYFIGREFAQTLSAQPSHESREVRARQLPFIAITTAKFHREHFLLNFLEVIKFPGAFYQLFRIFTLHKPDVIMSFGGYIALPVCIMGKIFGARIITHEQTRTAGLANQWIAMLADVVALAYPEAACFFDNKKVVVTGNPIRESLLKEYKQAPSFMRTLDQDLPLVYITGGSQGSHIINQTVGAILPKLLTEFRVVHQCGVSHEQSYLKELQKQADLLPPEVSARYSVREWIEAKDVSYLMHQAKFVIARGGANTVQELMLSGTPAIFIPLAFAYQNEQEKNARAMVDEGAALLLEQKDLFPDSLWQKITVLKRRYEKLKANALNLAQTQIRDGAARLARLIMK